jgi:hypothetical protein
VLYHPLLKLKISARMALQILSQPAIIIISELQGQDI